MKIDEACYAGDHSFCLVHEYGTPDAVCDCFCHRGGGTAPEYEVAYEVVASDGVPVQVTQYNLVTTSSNPQETYLPDVSALLEWRFNELALRWHQEVGGQSSPSRVIGNSAYLAIVAMSRSAIPFILRDLRVKGGYWYPALRAINEALGQPSPFIPATDRGNVPRMTQIWLDWGRRNGFQPA